MTDRPSLAKQLGLVERWIVNGGRALLRRAKDNDHPMTMTEAHNEILVMKAVRQTLIEVDDQNRRRAEIMREARRNGHVRR